MRTPKTSCLIELTVLLALSVGCSPETLHRADSLDADPDVDSDADEPPSCSSIVEAPRGLRGGTMTCLGLAAPCYGLMRLLGRGALKARVVVI
jgi:hypothetical protein